MRDYGGTFWVMTRTAPLGPSLLVEALEGGWGRVLHGHCLLPSEGGCLGHGLGRAVFVHRECAGSAIISGRGWGSPSLAHFCFCAGLSSAEACLRGNMCGTRVVDVRAAILTIL